MDYAFVQAIALPLAFGLLGFVEPCSIASTLLFVKFLEGKTAATKIAQTLLFAVTRAAFIGVLGAAAVLVGSAFIAYQKAAWLLLGIAYTVMGAAVMANRTQWFARTLGPSVSGLAGPRGSVALGFIFGLNIPACAAPLLAALLAMAAATGASGAALGRGFISLALFGLALSLPLIAAVFFKRARDLLDRAARHASRYPKWAGLVLILLGIWSIWFGAMADISLK